MEEELSIERAARHLRAGERKQAVALLAELVRADPNSAAAWYLMSFAAPERERKLEAVQRALRINPTNERASQRLKLLRESVEDVEPLPDVTALDDGVMESAAGAPGRKDGQQRRAGVAIEVEDLRRIYQVRTGVIRRSTKEVLAVDGISFRVETGELFGLLGPNGAGKTTTVKMLTTLLIPTSGEARVAGFDVMREAKEIRPLIGFIYGGERGLYWRLSGYDNLRYFASLYHVEPAVAERRIPRLLDLVGLESRGEEKVEGYSRGMKQRLHVARALLHDPQILFLDEPTLGLDPVGARRLRSVIQHLQAENKTILLTTHYMFEADQLCDRIAVIDQGRIVALDTPEGLKQHVRDLSVIEIEVFGIGDETVERIRAQPFVEAVAVEDRNQRQYLRVHSPRGSEAVSTLMGLLQSVPVGTVQVREPTLEDAYIRLVDGGDASV